VVGGGAWRNSPKCAIRQGNYVGGFTEDRNFACSLRIVFSFETRAPRLYYAALPEHEAAAFAVAQFFFIFFLLSLLTNSLYCSAWLSFPLVFIGWGQFFVLYLTVKWSRGGVC